jgi:flagellin-like hook-associated protein FlgL
MSDVVLSAGVRQNLLALQGTANLMSITQHRLATGKKVNSALDNPVNFFTASGLRSRANDLNALLDAMSNGIKTIEAADNGITAINRTIESMKSTLIQARQDKSFKSTSYSLALPAPAVTDDLSFSGGSVGTTPVSVDLTNAQGVRTGAAYTALDFDNAGTFAGNTLTFSIAANGGTAHTIVVAATSATNLTVSVDGGTATSFTVASTNAVTGAELRDALNAGFAAATTPLPITTSFAGGAIVFTANNAVSSSTADVTVSGVAGAGTVTGGNFGFGGGGTLTKINVAAQTVDQIVSAISANSNLTGKVQASNDNGQLRLFNLSTLDLTIAGINTTGTIDGSAGTATITGNDVRRHLVKQFNDLRNQLDKLADDSSFNGVNLLRGDKLKVTLNETGTSAIEIQAKDVNGNIRPINSVNLNIQYLLDADVDADTNIDSLLDTLAQALGIIRAQASDFGSNLSVVQYRTEFTKSMINTLEVGADNLVLADNNEEGANMLALQTRQQLSTTALSLASQADQAVLRLFG